MALDRRTFLVVCGALAGAGGPAAAAFQRSRLPPLVPSWGAAVNDPTIVRSAVTLASGSDAVPALLAYPRAPGRYPAVIVIHASWLVEPYVAETVAMLAVEGFVGLAVDLFHFFPRVSSWEEARRTQGPDTAKLLETEFREPRMVRDLQAGVNYLRAQAFVAPGGVGVLGFCGGGWNALLFGAQSSDVGCIVAFYAPVGLSDVQHRAPLEVAQYIRVPVLYHGAGVDPNAPSGDVDRLQTILTTQNTPFERYTYDAAHGFFAYDRDGIFDSAAAALAWQRTVTVLRRYAGGPLRSRPLAPAATPQRSEDRIAAPGAHLILHAH